MKNHIQTYLIVILVLIVLSLAGLWCLVPLLSGLPWIPAKRDRIIRALDSASLRSGNKFYDLGAGDGLVLMIAAEAYGAFAIGIETSPIHCLIAVARSLIKGLRGNT